MTVSLPNYRVSEWQEFFQAMGWVPANTAVLLETLSDMFAQGVFFRPIDPWSESLIFAVPLRDHVPYPNEMRIRAKHAFLNSSEIRRNSQGFFAATSRQLVAIDEDLNWMLVHPYVNLRRYQKSQWGTSGQLSLWGSGEVVQDVQPYLWLADATELRPFVFSEIQIDVTIKLPSEPGLMNWAFIALLASSGLFGLIWAREEYEKAIKRVGVATAIMHRLGQFCQEIVELRSNS